MGLILCQLHVYCRVLPQKCETQFLALEASGDWTQNFERAFFSFLRLSASTGVERFFWVINLYKSDVDFGLFLAPDHGFLVDFKCRFWEFCLGTKALVSSRWMGCDLEMEPKIEELGVFNMKSKLSKRIAFGYGYVFLKNSANFPIGKRNEEKGGWPSMALGSVSSFSVPLG